MGKLLIKYKEKTSKKFGKEPEKRTLLELLDTGAIIIDKDSGPTSHQEADYLKKLLNLKKVGHSGTLDPKVTGVLIIGLEKATRLMEYMLKSDKEYIALMYIHKKISKDALNKVLEKFRGKITQTPPVISAVKRQARERTIYELEVLEMRNRKISDQFETNSDKINNTQYVLFKVRCERGTYIRKLCSDIGESLGVGAQMQELRRTKAGPCTENNNIISLDKLRNLLELYLDDKDKYEKELRKYIFPMENLLVDFKKVYLRDTAVNSICHGGDLAIPGVAKLDDEIQIGDEIAMFTQKGELIGMGMAYLNSSNVMKKKKGAFIKTNKVFMKIDTYPQNWKFLKEKIEN